MSLVVSQVPQLLRVARAMAGKTQRALADATGLSINKIWNFEHGYATPTEEEIVKLWQGLSTGPHKL